MRACPGDGFSAPAIPPPRIRRHTTEADAGRGQIAPMLILAEPLNLILTALALLALDAWLNRKPRVRPPAASR